MKKIIKSKTHSNIEINDDILAKAIERGKSRQDSVRALSIEVVKDPVKSIILFFEGNNQLSLPLEDLPEFKGLSDSQLKHLEIGMFGSAICLEEKDLHVSIMGLLLSNPWWINLARKMTASVNGSITSHKKTASSRSNGAKGGRPKTRHSAHKKELELV